MFFVASCLYICDYSFCFVLLSKLPFLHVLGIHTSVCTHMYMYNTCVFACTCMYMRKGLGIFLRTVKKKTAAARD